MKIVFFGNPHFSIPTLRALHDSNHQVVSVITNPKQKMGRGLKWNSTPVKLFCEKNNIPFNSFKKFNKEAYDYLDSLKADLFVVVAFKILPEKIINIPSFGSINLHPSILPKYRGSSPIQHALLNGDSKSGITIFKLNQKVDSGDIVLQEECLIDSKIIFSDLYNKMAEFGAELLLKAVGLIELGQFQYIPQSEEKVSYAPKIQSLDCKINWNNNSRKINNQIRAFSNIPGAYSFIKISEKNNKKIKLFGSNIEYSYLESIEPGECIFYDGKILIGTIDYPVAIDKFQIEGKNVITSKDFSNMNLFADNKEILFE